MKDNLDKVGNIHCIFSVLLMTCIMTWQLALILQLIIFKDKRSSNTYTYN